MDLIFKVSKLPDWKEAEQAHIFRMQPGGKGLNQAVAAKRLGANVSLVSAVGADYFGEEILKALDAEGVNRENVVQVGSENTSVTGVFVNDDGDPSFIGWKGLMDSRLDPAQILKAESQIKEADVMLVTLEVSRQAIWEAVKIAEREDVKVVLNPAPPPDPTNRLGNLLNKVDWLVPNKWEASKIISLPKQVSPDKLSPAQLAYQLYQMGAKNACVTTSEAGCVVSNKDGTFRYGTHKVSAVDTTGGSDAFCASLGVELAKDTRISEAVAIANAAGAIKVSKDSGYMYMPDERELTLFRERRNRIVPVRIQKKELEVEQ
jgi:ribokinase